MKGGVNRGIPQGLKSVRENFKRPYGARDDLPLFPAMNAPGYYQTPLRGANRRFVVPPRRPKSSSHAHTKARIFIGSGRHG